MMEIEIGARTLIALGGGTLAWLINRWWAYRSRGRRME